MKIERANRVTPIIPIQALQNERQRKQGQQIKKKRKQPSYDPGPGGDAS